MTARILGALGAVALAVSLAVGARAEQAVPSRASAGQSPDAMDLTAVTANVAKPGTAIKIQILRWSTDDERAALVAAMNPPRPAAAPSSPDPAPEAAAAPEAAPQGEGARAGRAGRAGGARGAAAGRRGGGPEAPPPPPPPTPIELLTRAIVRAPTVGYLWAAGATGYSIKYAYRVPVPGGERILLVTNRRLGEYVPEWKPLPGAPVTDYAFTLIDIRLDAKGLGEGRTSLTTPVVVNAENKTMALENYAAAPVVLRAVRR